MIVILDNLRSALNVGSIIRTCEGLGIEGVYTCGITPEISNKKVLKTSLGAEEELETKHFKTTLEAVRDLKKNSFIIVGLEITNESTPIEKVVSGAKNALIVGNEVSGISEDVLEECDLITHIPMKGKKESLNVSVAFGIAAYGLLSQLDK